MDKFFKGIGYIAFCIFYCFCLAKAMPILLTQPFDMLFFKAVLFMVCASILLPLMITGCVRILYMATIYLFYRKKIGK